MNDLVFSTFLYHFNLEHHFDLKHRKLSTAALPTWFRIREMVSGVPNASLVELGKKLLSAARSGDKAEVGRLLAKGAPITSDWLGTSPLHLAAQYGHADTAEVLLRLKAFITFLAREKVAFESSSFVSVQSDPVYAECPAVISMKVLQA